MLWGREESKVHVPLRRHPKRMVHPPPQQFWKVGRLQSCCAQSRWPRVKGVPAAHLPEWALLMGAAWLRLSWRGHGGVFP